MIRANGLAAFSDRPARSVLIVEDEQSIRDVLVELFDVPGNAVVAAESLPVARDRLKEQRFDLIISDLRLGGKRDGGLQVLALAGMLSPDATALVLTAFPDDGNRQASARLGALHFLEKPVDLAVIASLAGASGVLTAFDSVAEAHGGPHGEAHAELRVVS
jgi:two-component system, response regulator, stage 0 sporulation protein F